MKLKKLMKHLGSYLDPASESMEEQDEGLSKVLKKLKKKEAKLKDKADSEKDKMLRHLLEQEINLVHAQRKKGIQLLAELRSKRAASESSVNTPAGDASEDK